MYFLLVGLSADLNTRCTSRLRPEGPNVMTTFTFQCAYAYASKPKLYLLALPVQNYPTIQYFDNHPVLMKCELVPAIKLVCIPSAHWVYGEWAPVWEFWQNTKFCQNSAAVGVVCGIFFGLGGSIWGGLCSVLAVAGFSLVVACAATNHRMLHCTGLLCLSFPVIVGKGSGRDVSYTFLL